MKQAKRESLPAGRQSLNKQERFSAIEQFEQAGNISVKEFAAAFQVSEATFYNWRKQYRAKKLQQLPAAGFIPVDRSEVQGPQNQGRIFAEFRGIVFYQRVEPSYLKSLL
ncbi:IS66 family insertion sequence element accessory protein TnpA [Flavitalea flava]